MRTSAGNSPTCCITGKASLASKIYSRRYRESEVGSDAPQSIAARDELFPADLLPILRNRSRAIPPTRLWYIKFPVTDIYLPSPAAS